MKVCKSLSDLSVSVEYCLNHLHHIAIAHLRIPDNVRYTIAAKLQEGVQIERILNDIRNNVDGELGREHLINKQDIRNIEHQFQVDGIAKHADDSQSVDLWIKEMQRGEYDPVLLYKAQGVEEVYVGQNCKDIFQKEDFAIALQTQFQKDMLQRFGNDSVCLDSTHCTNHYSFPLTTVMVVDEFGEGIPVAYMISNREDEHILRVFFEQLKRCVDCIEPQFFMTDDAPQ